VMSRFKSSKQKALEETQARIVRMEAEMAEQQEQQEQQRRAMAEQQEQQRRAMAEQQEQQRRARVARELYDARVREEQAILQARIASQKDELRRQEAVRLKERSLKEEKDRVVREERLEREREERRIEALQLRRKALQTKTTPEALRDLRDKVRRKYQLDIQIWANRGYRKPDRPLVEKDMEEADAVLQEIMTMITSWEESDIVWTSDEWKLAQEIKQRLLMDGKRMWAGNPPWNEN